MFVFVSVKVQREEGFHVDLDDYLMGLLQLAGELVSGSMIMIFFIVHLQGFLDIIAST